MWLNRTRPHAVSVDKDEILSTLHSAISRKCYYSTPCAQYISTSLSKSVKQSILSIYSILCTLYYINNTCREREVWSESWNLFVQVPPVSAS